MRNSAQFVRFCITGGIGFVVDFTVLHLLLLTGAGPFTARLVSIGAALAVTWLLNRRFTFRSEQPYSWKEIAGYLSVNGLGAFINYAVYTLCILLFSLVPTAALVAGSATALLFNFFGNRHFVFKTGKRQP